MKPKKKLRINGKIVKSDFEYRVYEQLKQVVPKGAVIEYEVDKIPYVIQHYYVPDFTVTLKDGRVFRIEAKGNGRQFDSHVRQKMVAVKDQHPEMKPLIVFYSDGKIGPKRKDGSFRKQSDWGNQHGYTYSIKDVQKEWFK